MIVAYTIAMELNNEICYQALLSHDSRFDGVLYVGVATTGIYCRPICPAKTPRNENCAFYPSAAAAERAGYRPCLRCRPELAPGNARIDAMGRLAAAAAGSLEDGALTDMSVAELAGGLGVSDRHLRRAIEREFGVSPVQLAQTQRLLIAKRLLTDTRMPVTEIAFASGFASLRRFNALFKQRYRLNPTDLRRAVRTETSDLPPQTLVCEIAYRPPLDWEALLTFLSDRATSGVEAIEGQQYLRTVIIGRSPAIRGWIVVGPSRRKDTLTVELSASLAPALVPVLARVKRLFDVTANPLQIARHLGDIAAGHPGLRVPGAFDGFETAVRAILGQQISVRAATTLSGRFARAFGELIETPFAALTRAAPSVERIARAEPAEIAALGIIPARAGTILALARAVAEGGLMLGPAADIERTINALKSLPGIGEWTAQYIAMRALGWPDAFPHTDLGIYKALGEKNPRRVLEIAERWRPWRAYATMHLWKSLEICKEVKMKNTNEIVYYTYAETPIDGLLSGLRLLLTSDGVSLTGVYMSGQANAPVVGPAWIRSDDSEPFAEARRQLAAYFRGDIRAFNLPLNLRGTEFQKRVWAELAAIPYGETSGYGELARRLGNPNAARAVGFANSRNPIGIIIPCHRVIGASGSLTGYAGGLSRKEALLKLEAGFLAGREGA